MRAKRETGYASATSFLLLPGFDNRDVLPVIQCDPDGPAILHLHWLHRVFLRSSGDVEQQDARLVGVRPEEMMTNAADDAFFAFDKAFAEPDRRHRKHVIERTIVPAAWAGLWDESAVMVVENTM